MDAAWLIKRQAVTVLPSVANLKALRVKDQRAKPLVGFGDRAISLARGLGHRPNDRLVEGAASVMRSWSLRTSCTSRSLSADRRTVRS
jgi:hypothetical protein